MFLLSEFCLTWERKAFFFLSPSVLPLNWQLKKKSRDFSLFPASLFPLVERLTSRTSKYCLNCCCTLGLLNVYRLFSVFVVLDLFIVRRSDPSSGAKIRSRDNRRTIANWRRNKKQVSSFKGKQDNWINGASERASNFFERHSSNCGRG